jgi:hypothetical protein
VDLARDQRPLRAGAVLKMTLSQRALDQLPEPKMPRVVCGSA